MSYSSLSIVEDIATLALLSVKGVVIVTDPLLGGTFVWNSANLSTPVSFDIGHAIYVPPSTAPTGASGAWVRQYSGPINLLWFGAQLGSGGAAATTLALANVGIFGRYLKSLYGGLSLFCPPGDYFFDGSWPNGCLGCFTNFGAFNWLVANTTWTNVTDGGAMPGAIGNDNNVDGSPNFSYINQTVPGSSSFTLVDPTQASRYSVGQNVMLASLDTQGYGGPENPQQFESVVIKTKDAVTGVMGIHGVIRYEHRTDYPELNINNAPVGKARVMDFNVVGWLLGHPVLGSFSAGPLTYDYDLSIIGPATFNLPAVMSPSVTYQPISARRLYTYKVTCIPFGESICEEVIHEQLRLTETGNSNLVDKMIGSITWRGLDTDVLVGCQNANDRLLMESCRVGGVTTGATRNFRSVKCDFLGSAALGHVRPYGLSQSQQFENCRVYLDDDSTVNFPPVLDGVTTLTFDGTNINFGSGGAGLIRVLKTWILAGNPWESMVPGGYLAFKATDIEMFPGDTGVMRVLSTTEDATYIYTQTDSPLTSVPVWCTKNTFWYFHLNEVTFRGCTGSDLVRQYSDACEAGFRYFERKRIVIDGLSANRSYAFFDVAGTLTRIYANVPLGKNFAGATAQVSWATFDQNSNFAQDSGGTVFTVDCGTAGKRSVTLAAGSFAGLGSDTLTTLSGSSATSLPDRIVGAEGSSFTNSNFATAETPQMIEFIFEYDSGQVRKLMPLNSAHSGGTFVQMQGLLP